MRRRSQRPPFSPNAGSRRRRTIGEDDYFGVIDDLWRTYRAHDRIDVWFAPPGPQWVSDAFMQRIAAQAEAYDVGVQTHVTESLYEMLHGPLYYGKPTLHHLRDLGVLSPRFFDRPRRLADRAGDRRARRDRGGSLAQPELEPAAARRHRAAQRAARARRHRRPRHGWHDDQ